MFESDNAIVLFPFSLQYYDARPPTRYNPNSNDRTNDTYSQLACIRLSTAPSMLRPLYYPLLVHTTSAPDAP